MVGRITSNHWKVDLNSQQSLKKLYKLNFVFYCIVNTILLYVTSLHYYRLCLVHGCTRRSTRSKRRRRKSSGWRYLEAGISAGGHRAAATRSTAASSTMRRCLRAWIRTRKKRRLAKKRPGQMRRMQRLGFVWTELLGTIMNVMLTFKLIIEAKYFCC